MDALETLAGEQYCYLTTTGRRTGKPHEIEIWFGLENGVLYLLSGGRERSDWVRNLQANPSVSLRIGKAHFSGVARLVEAEDEDALARGLLAAKYYGWREGQPLGDWARRSLPVAVALQPA
ncbi:MAG: nitroreductase family deazaflavin-dependent oxidoreductase [Anaerolineales bacterium]|nr:nitroreductase family deazaflavin-dependent oxidoreductase [Anaerolineales bacterium]